MSYCSCWVHLAFSHLDRHLLEKESDALAFITRYLYKSRDILLKLLRLWRDCPGMLCTRLVSISKEECTCNKGSAVEVHQVNVWMGCEGRVRGCRVRKD